MKNMIKVPITQTKAWQQLQEDLGETSFFEKGSGYQYLAILKHTPVGHYLYLPYGPVYDDKRGLNNALKSLKLLARRHQAIFIRIEPQSTEFVNHLPQNAQKTQDLNPKETWLLDLTGKEEELKSRLPSRLLRYHRNATKNGITITTSHNPSDIHYLLDLQQALAKQKRINTFSEDYLKTELKQPFATLYLVKYEGISKDIHRRVVPSEGGARDVLAGEEAALAPWDANCRRQTGPVESKVIAAGLVFDTKSTRYNLQGAQNDLGRKLHATGILTIQLILDAKAKRQGTFDFWGIAPEDAPKSHPWAGFTAFKKTFAGREVDYSGTYDLVYDKNKYRLYRLLRKFNRLIRR